MRHAASDKLLTHRSTGPMQLRLRGRQRHAGRAGRFFAAESLDGNAHGEPTPIVLQPLAADGLELTGSPTTLLTNSDAWEANVIEGPG